MLGPDTHSHLDSSATISQPTVFRQCPPQSTTYCSLLESKLKDSSTTPISLPMHFLKAITNDFSEEQVLGRGGFGVVYKGVLQNGKAIAVKKLSETTNNLDDDQFHKEVTNLFGLKHKNIVQLVGYCAESRWEATEINGKYVMAEVRKRLICFEYINNKSLDKHLAAESHGLEWHIGYEIVKGICRGLHYLHTECQIVHLDIKPQNILLDQNMKPKVADFGMSRLFGTQQSRIITQSRGGTPGYMAPEYLDNGLVSFKADIFSLGVIIIELMTGGRDYPRSEESYGHFIWNVVGSWRKRLEAGWYIPLEKFVEQVKTCTLIALMCVNAEPNIRPTTQDIIEELTDKDLSTKDIGPQESGDASGIHHEPKNRPLLKRLRELFKSSLFTGPGTSQLERHKLVHLDGPISFTMEDFLLADVVGMGTYGTVYKATLDTGKILAIKGLRQDMIKGHKELKNELAVLGKVRHPNLLVPRAYHLGTDQVFIIFDYMPNGSLSALLHARATKSGLDWATQMTIAKGTARGLTYLHDEMSIIHGNLTATNVLLDEQSQPKMADFWLFRLLTTSAASSSSMLAAAHEQRYRAPELSSTPMKATTEADVYSLGVIIFELLTGESPSCMSLPRHRQVMNAILSDYKLDLDLPPQDELGRTLELVLRCVDPLPWVRPQAREVLEFLEKICPGPGNGTAQHQQEDAFEQQQGHIQIQSTVPEDDDDMGSPVVDVATETQEALEQLSSSLSSRSDGGASSSGEPDDGEEQQQHQQPEQMRPGTEDGSGLGREEPSPLQSRRGPEPSAEPREHVPKLGQRDAQAVAVYYIKVLEQVLSPLEDDGAGLSEHHRSPLVRTETQEEVLDHTWSGSGSGPEADVAQADAFEQLGHIRSSTQKDDDMGSPVVPTETQEVVQVLEQVSSRSEDGRASSSSSGGPSAWSVRIDGWEWEVPSSQQQPEPIHEAPEDVARPSNPSPSPSMQPEDREVPQLHPPEHIRSVSGPEDGGARQSADQLPSMQPDDGQEEEQQQQQSEQIRPGTEDGAALSEKHSPLLSPPEALEVEEQQSRHGPEPGVETSEHQPQPALEQREAPAVAALEQVEESGTGPEYGTSPSEEPPAPSLTPEDQDPDEVSSPQREHVQPQADDDEGRSARTRPVVFSFVFVCFPFLMRE